MVGRWLVQYERGGLSAMLDVYIPQRKRKPLTPAQLQQLQQALAQPKGFASYGAIRQWRGWRVPRPLGAASRPNKRMQATRDTKAVMLRVRCGWARDARRYTALARVTHHCAGVLPITGGGSARPDGAMPLLIG